MSTVQRIRAAVKRLQQTYITKGKVRRFACGIAALSLEPFVSLNAAGRRSAANRSTGENRIRRTVTDTGLGDQLQRLLVTEALGSRTGYWYCSLDHSQFGPFCIAVLAVSVRKGRAIPIWVQVNVSEAALIGPLLTALETLLGFLAGHAPTLKLVLVMDRWFASDKLFTLFETYGTYFIARSKGDKKVILPWDPSWWREPLGDISQAELPVRYRSHRLRFIRSSYRPGMKEQEPWFLLTNLPEAITRTMVLHRYAERFEIEEAFKDTKWLRGLEWQRVRKPEVIRTLLLFTFLGGWLLWRYVARQQRAGTKRVHPKKRLSWFREAWEHWQRLLRTPLLPPLAVAYRVE